jgi:hypothetical protein
VLAAATSGIAVGSGGAIGTAVVLGVATSVPAVGDMGAQARANTRRSQRALFTSGQRQGSPNVAVASRPGKVNGAPWVRAVQIARRGSVKRAS